MLTMLTSNADFVWDSLRNFAGSTGIAGFFSEMGWGSVAMICVAFFLLYLAIRHKFEPLLLFTIAFGMLLTNLPGANLYHTELFADCLSNLSIDTYNLVTFIVFIWRESCVCTHYKSTFCCCFFAFC